MYQRFAISAASLGLGVVAWQAWIVAREYFLRHRRYALAKDAALRRGKPLLVVGRPGSGLRIYGCGDVTLDLDPGVLRDCPRSGMVADVRRLPFDTGQFGAAFCSHVLDCLPGPEDVLQAYQELRRVADEVYVCSTSPQNVIWRWLSPEVSTWVSAQDGRIVAKAHPRVRRWIALGRPLQR
jgi:hypothetical protein